MLAPYIPIIEEWLAAVPHLSAVDLLSRLEAHAPGRSERRRRRTVQRLVKNWRSTAARQLISSAAITLVLSLDTDLIAGHDTRTYLKIEDQSRSAIKER
jgi:hypothetical protein